MPWGPPCAQHVDEAGQRVTASPLPVYNLGTKLIRIAKSPGQTLWARCGQTSMVRTRRVARSPIIGVSSCPRRRGQDAGMRTCGQVLLSVSYCGGCAERVAVRLSGEPWSLQDRDPLWRSQWRRVGPCRTSVVMTPPALLHSALWSPGMGAQAAVRWLWALRSRSPSSCGVAGVATYRGSPAPGTSSVSQRPSAVSM